MTSAFRAYVSVVEFAAQHKLYYQGFSGILVLKSERHWLLLLPNGDGYWNGQRLAAAMIPQIEGDRLLMPKDELEQAFDLFDTQPPALAAPTPHLTGADLFVVGGPEFPNHTKYREHYTAYPINHSYDADVFHRPGPMFTLPIGSPDMRPKVILRLAQEELSKLADKMTFQKAELLVFRNRAWAIIGTLNAADTTGQPAKADYIAMMRVKGGKYQLKLGLSFR